MLAILKRVSSSSLPLAQKRPGKRERDNLVAIDERALYNTICKLG
jgi:hypothetical protein